MKIIFFTHPDFMGSVSMPKYTGLLAEGMKAKGYDVDIWQPHAKFYAWPAPAFLKKWLGYLDQFVVFPREVKKKMARLPSDTLYVITDQALGPWVPLVKNKRHIIHCHDFLAQYSALGRYPQNKTSFTGKLYQRFIRNGYRQGKNFISISKKTQEDLHFFLGRKPTISEVVYNGLNLSFAPMDSNAVRTLLLARIAPVLRNGYILHVGGNLWYKNRKGVLEAYQYWQQHTASPLPLLMVGQTPTEELMQLSAGNSNVLWLDTVTDELLLQLYAGAECLFYPSIAEGFGWPVAEALASGIPVLTTAAAPMTEVGGDAAFYIAVAPDGDKKNWCQEASQALEKIIGMSLPERQQVIQKGLSTVKRFDRAQMLKRINEIYRQI